MDEKEKQRHQRSVYHLVMLSISHHYNYITLNKFL